MIVHGAAGAVGSIAVQLAHAAGAHVIATGRPAARALALELGADRFVDLENDDLGALAGVADVVFDTVGGDVLAGSPAMVKPAGSLVSVVSPPPTDRDDIGTVFFVRHPDRAQLVELARLTDAGQVRPQVGAVYPLAEAKEAFRAKSAHGIPGRIVLEV